MRNFLSFRDAALRALKENSRFEELMFEQVEANNKPVKFLVEENDDGIHVIAEFETKRIKTVYEYNVSNERISANPKEEADYV